MSQNRVVQIESGDWQGDKTRKHILVWKDDQTSLQCEMELTELRDYLPGAQFSRVGCRGNPASTSEPYSFFSPIL